MTWKSPVNDRSPGRSLNLWLVVLKFGEYIKSMQAEKCKLTVSTVFTDLLAYYFFINSSRNHLYILRVVHGCQYLH